jgi:hypothetical protein
MINLQVLKTALEVWGTINEKDYWESNKEKHFESHIMEVLTSSGMAVIKLPDETVEYVFPDLLVHCVLPGPTKYTFYIECKAASKRYRRSQKASFKVFEEFVDVFPARNKKEWMDLIEMLIYKASVHHKNLTDKDP